MTNVLIFGGTTEGRELARVCAAMQVKACVCVASDYGEQLLPRDESVSVHTGRLDILAMVQLMKELKPEMIFDATHPYADQVSKNAMAACRETGTMYQRVLRQESITPEDGREIWVSGIEEAVAVLEQDQRPVLVTTGSKELKLYGQLKHVQERIYARVLPSHDGIRACEELGLTGSHIIAMQGPFNQELNSALLKQINAGWLVTKESGSQGGFLEKLAAAEELGVRTVIIGRPQKETGISLAQASRQLAAMRCKPNRQIALIGIGMGTTGLMTEEAGQAVSQCEAIIGAGRMLAAVRELAPGAAVFEHYQPAEIVRWLKENPDYHRVGIILSGDTGFYSGAKTLKAALAEADHTWELRMLPGISTVSYLCARLGTGWDDVYLCSLHGRSGDLPEILRQHPRVFCLLGGRQTVAEVCEMLKAKEPARFRISAGESLSYPQERIATGTPEEISRMEWGKLVAVLIERD